MRLLKLTNIEKDRPIVLLGSGNMGGAMLKGWLRNGLRGEAVRVISPNARKRAKYYPDLPPESFLSSIDELEQDLLPSAVVLAVKPQVMGDVLPSCAPFWSGNSLFLSIAAGKSLTYFADQLGENAQIVRAMPNTPSSIGLGMTAAVANPLVTREQRGLCADLLESVGAFEWLDDEGLMDAVTAVSGSGPAYIFLLAESLSKAAIQQGIPADTARKLAYQTIMGAAALLDSEFAKDNELSDEETATRLRKQVTSPNGTTAAALDVLMAEDFGLPRLMENAIQRATDRSRELNASGKPLLNGLPDKPLIKN